MIDAMTGIAIFFSNISLGRSDLMNLNNLSFMDMMGFRYECGPNRPGDGLPVLRTMLKACSSGTRRPSARTTRLPSCGCSPNRRETAGGWRPMAEFVQALEADYQPAELSCIPVNVTAITNGGLLKATHFRSVDCKTWQSEVPKAISLYHAYIRGYNRDVR